MLKNTHSKSSQNVSYPLPAWNNTINDYLIDKCIHQLFEEQVSRNADKYALIYKDKKITYLELNEKSSQFANYLIDLGVKSETFVAISMGRTIEFIISVLGILKAGGVYVPLDPSYPQEQLQYMLNDSAAPILITELKYADIFVKYKGKFIHLENDWQNILNFKKKSEKFLSKTDNLAYIIYTSGSTGKPKGICCIHSGLTNRILWMRQQYNVKFNDIFLLKTSFNFDVSLWEIFLPLISGACLVIPPPNTHKNPEELISIINQYRITHVHFVPSMLQISLNCKNVTSCQSLKHVFSSGEILPFNLQNLFFNKLKSRLHNLYGPTEASIDVTYWECQANTEMKFVPIGHPIWNTQIYILDSQLNQVPIGTVGEIYIGGVGLARGYLNNPELTAQKFITNPFDLTHQSKLYRTGDLGRYLADGNIEYIGRNDQQIKLRGYRIELGEIESALNEQKIVQESAVLCREDKEGQKQLVAYVVCRESEDKKQTDIDHIEELRKGLSLKLPHFMIPSLFVLLKEMPLLPNGKLDRKALPKPTFVELPLTKDYEAAKTPIQKQLSQIWSELLGVQPIGINDDFFALGGNSLSIYVMVTKIREKFKIEIPLSKIISSATIKRLSVIVENLLSEEKEFKRELVINPVSREQLIPLSFSQQRLWFLDKLLPQSGLYNINVAFHLEGSLDVECLRKAFNAVLKRHEILRTTIQAVNGQPIQVIAPHLDFEIQCEEIELRKKTLSRALKKIGARPFDLSAGPLMRSSLFYVNKEANRYLLLISLHHIIADRWSLHVLYRELNTAYNDLKKGKTITWENIPVQYADFTVWQRNWLQGKIQQEQKEYWTRHLLGASGTLHLPTDRPRPEILTYRGEVYFHKLPKQLTERMRALSTSHQMTLYMTLLAAFQVLLYRYSNQNDIVVGTPVANRHYPGIEGSIGFFVNTLAIKVECSGNPRFVDFLKQVKEVILKGYEHQDIPFEELVSTLEIKRDLRYHPIFQVMFILEELTTDRLSLDGLRTKEKTVKNKFSKFDLTYVVAEQEDGLEVQIEYASDLYEEETVSRMACHYQRLLEEIILNPEERIENIKLITEIEQKKLLEWNNTVRDYPVDKCIHHLFEEQVSRMKSKIAIVCGDRSISYVELNRSANKLANYIVKEFKIQPEQQKLIVGVCLEPTIELYISIFAILKLGYAYLPLDPTYPSARLNYMLGDAVCGFLITSYSFKNIFSSYKGKFLSLSSTKIEEIKNDESYINHNASATDLAYIIYTSGSTGNPKGVAVEHKAICNLATAQRSILNITHESRILQFASICFDASISEWIAGLLHGGTIYLISSQMRADIDSVIQFIQKNEISIVTLPPTVLSFFPDITFPHLKTLIVAGESCPETILNNWVKKIPRLINGYGPTEAGICATTHICDGERPAAVIGRPIQNMQIYIMDHHGAMVPIGVTGEILIGGVGLAREYLNRKKLTKEKFTTISRVGGNDDNIRVYKTGDMGRYLCDGAIEFLGRADRQVKVNGHRIELDEIETVLTRQREIKQAAIILHEDNKEKSTSLSLEQKRILAYILFKENEIKDNNSEQELIDKIKLKLKSLLPNYMIPSLFIARKDFILLPNGKIDRNKLIKDSDFSFNSTKLMYPPRNFIEFQLVEIWGETLNTTSINIFDNFFDIGGNSLLGITLVTKVRLIYPFVEVIDLFRYPCIAEFASFISSCSINQIYHIPLRNIFLINSRGSQPPLFLIHPSYGLATSYSYLSVYLKDQPIFCISNPYFAHEDKGFDSIEQMSSEYVKLIKDIKVNKPYRLGGWSFGGIVALEMARQLKDEIELVLLIDSIRFDVNEKSLSYFADKRLISQKTSFDTDSAEAKIVQREQDKSLDLIKKYNFLPYQGRVALIKALNNPIEQNILNGWFTLIDNVIELYFISAGHDDLFKGSNVVTLSGIISQILNNNYKDIQNNRNVTKFDKYFLYLFLTKQLMRLGHIYKLEEAIDKSSILKIPCDDSQNNRDLINQGLFITINILSEIESRILFKDNILFALDQFVLEKDERFISFIMAQAKECEKQKSSKKARNKNYDNESDDWVVIDEDSLKDKEHYEKTLISVCLCIYYNIHKNLIFQHNKNNAVLVRFSSRLSSYLTSVEEKNNPLIRGIYDYFIKEKSNIKATTFNVDSSAIVNQSVFEHQASKLQIRKESSKNSALEKKQELPYFASSTLTIASDLARKEPVIDWNSIFLRIKQNKLFADVFQSQTLFKVIQAYQEIRLTLNNNQEVTSTQLKLLGKALKCELDAELIDWEVKTGELNLIFKTDSIADQLLNFIRSGRSGLYCVSESFNISGGISYIEQGSWKRSRSNSLQAPARVHPSGAFHQQQLHAKPQGTDKRLQGEHKIIGDHLALADIWRKPGYL